VNPIKIVGYPILLWKLRSLKSFRRALADVKELQLRLLQEKLRMVAGSRFAADFGLKPLMNIREFQKALPVAGYDRVKPYVEQMMRGRFPRSRVAFA